MRQLRHLVILAAVACGGSDSGNPTNVATPATVTISATSGPMESLNDTRDLTATVRDASGAAMPGAVVSWTTSDQSTVTVGPATGVTTTATSHGNGNATVTATSSPASAQLALVVAQKFATLVVAPASTSIAPGATAQIVPTAQDARGATIVAGAAASTYQSSNTAAATVDATGLVHGIADGASTITATLVRDGLTRTASSTITVATGGGQSFPTTATVAATPGIVFSPPTVDIAAGGTVTWNFGTVAHNVTFDFVNGVPASIGSQSNASASRTFAIPGIFSYECTIHPGMAGTVIVH